MNASGDILLELLTVLDQSHADGLVSHRRSLRKPLTLFAAQMLIKEYKRFGDANLAVEEQVLRGWVGFKSDWIKPQRNSSIPLRGTAALAEDLKQEITNAGLGRSEGPDHQAGEQLRLERFQLH